MFDLFLSYHTRDRERVKALAHALRTSGLSVFLDRWYLAPGQPWPQKLEETLSECRAVAVCIGPGVMGPWQQREMNLALERQVRQAGFPVIPVLLPGAEPALGFLSQNTWVDLREHPDDPALLQILALAARGEPPGPELQKQVRATLAAVCPYRGLQYFREEDAAFFFGREEAVSKLLNAVDRHSLVAVVGASGSGKSSVVRAGLVPALRQGALGKVWEIATLVPTDRPLHALATALMPLLEPEMSETDRLVEIGKQARHLHAGELALRDVIERVLDKQPGTERLLLVVDQWEELYTLANAAACVRFIDEILDTTAGERVSAVLTLRGDFFGDVLAHRPIADRLQDALVNLGPMNRQELEQAIRAPAEKLGLEFEPGLIDRILDDVGEEPGHLPLLEFVLRGLWERRGGPRLLDEAYKDMGRIKGALAQHADRVFAALSALEQQALPRVFLRLVRPGETYDTRRRATLEEIGAASAQLVKRLADERLLVTSRDLALEAETVEVSHEALIRHWDKLRGWVDADREFLLWRERLRTQRADWERAGRPDALLLHESLLQEAEAWVGRRGSDLIEAEREFIAHGTALREREAQAERERRQKELDLANSLAREKQASTKRLQVFSAILLVALVALGWFFYAARQEKLHAEEMTRLSISRLLTLKSENEAPKHFGRSMLLALAANAVCSATEARSSMLARVLEGLGEQTVLWGHRDEVRSIAFSPDGKLLASGSADNSVILWDVSERKPLGEPLKGHRNDGQGVISVAFSPNGKLLASASLDNTVILWDVASRKPLGEPLDGYGGFRLSVSGYKSVAFSPDGRLLASRGEDRVIRLWDVSERKLLGELKGHKSYVESVAFSPDGKLLASGSADNSVILWDVSERKLLGELKGHTWTVRTLAFSSDGKLLASGGDDTKVILWDVTGRERLGEPLGGHQDLVLEVFFRPDSKEVVSLSRDRTIIAWDVVSRDPSGEPFKMRGNPIESFAYNHDHELFASVSESNDTIVLWGRRAYLGKPVEEYSGWVTSLAISPDGRLLASGSRTDGVILWDVATRKQTAKPIEGQLGWNWSVAFSPDGRLLAAGKSGHLVVLWDATSRKLLAELEGDRRDDLRAAFSSDGKLFASGSDDSIVLWDVTGRKPLGELNGHGEAVSTVAFSPNSRLLASGSWDTNIILWDVVSRKPLGELKGHRKAISSVAFSPDGKLLASASQDQTVILWEVASRKSLGELKGHRNYVETVAFSPDGKLLASGDSDDTLILWDVASRTFLGKPLTGGGANKALTFSADGALLVSGGQPHMLSPQPYFDIVFWDVDLHSWRTRTCSMANRNLSRREWRELVGEAVPFQKVCPELPEFPDDALTAGSSAGF